MHFPHSDIKTCKLKSSIYTKKLRESQTSGNWVKTKVNQRFLNSTFGSFLVLKLQPSPGNRLGMRGQTHPNRQFSPIACRKFSCHEMSYSCPLSCLNSWVVRPLLNWNLLRKLFIWYLQAFLTRHKTNILMTQKIFTAELFPLFIENKLKANI